MKKYKLNKTKAFFFAVGLTFLTACTENIESETYTFTGEPIIEDTIESSETIETENIEVPLKTESSESSEVVETIDEPILSPIQVEENKFEAFENVYDFVYFNKDTDLYNDVNGEVVLNLEIYNKAYEIFKTNEIALIEYNETLYYVDNNDISYLGGDFIEIDITCQNCKMYRDGEVLVDTDIVTGKKSTPTHIGLYEIWSMEHDRYLIGPGYKCWVSYFMPFDGGIGLHDATWRDEFGGEIYKKDGSHGCVNMPLDKAKTVYENSKVGSKVLVHQKKESK